MASDFFGGCVAVLARDEALGELERALTEAFSREHGRLPTLFRTPLADGASVESLDPRRSLDTAMEMLQ